MTFFNAEVLRISSAWPCRGTRSDRFHSTIAFALLLALTLVPDLTAQDSANCVIEELTFRVTPDRVDEFIRHDADVWTKALSAQPGFLSKHVWTSQEHPDQVRLIVRWATREAWNNVPKKLLQETDKKFVAAMGDSNDFKMIGVKAIRQQWVPPQSSDSTTVKLAETVPRWLNETEDITVDFDLVYRKKKRYRAVSLLEFLFKEFDLENSDAENAQLVFECVDGYETPIPLGKAIETDGWIAVQDLDAPDGQQWTNIGKKTPAPYYVTWRDVPRSAATQYPWPYAVESIRLVTRDEFFEAAHPGDAEEAMPGYTAFRKHCLHCHSINGAGGKLGVELNAPRSVTEYWKPDELRKYIIDPRSFRLRNKMPSMKHVRAEEIDAILVYLKTIASQRATKNNNG